MNRKPEGQAGKPAQESGLDQALRSLLAPPSVSTLRQQRIQARVRERLAQPPHPFLPWRWQILLPGSAALLLAGAAVGWNAADLMNPPQDLAALGSGLMLGDD